MKRRAHTQNPKNETETKTEERGDPIHERGIMLDGRCGLVNQSAVHHGQRRRGDEGTEAEVSEVDGKEGDAI